MNIINLFRYFGLRNSANTAWRGCYVPTPEERLMQWKTRLAKYIQKKYKYVEKNKL